MVVEVVVEVVEVVVEVVEIVVIRSVL